MRRALLILALSSSACSHDLSAMFSAEAKTREADALLGAGDIEGARAAYRTVLVDHPDTPNALFGAVLTDLMLLGGAKPMVELADVCHQPPLDMAGVLFGPDGIIAQAVLAGEGQAVVTAHYFSEPGAAAADLAFKPTEVRSRIDGPTASDPRRTLFLTVVERTLTNSRWLFIDVNVDDIARDDEQVTPLVNGAEVELSRLAGSVSLYDGSTYSIGGELSGRLRFVDVGRVPGDNVVVELIDARIPASTLDSCGGDCGPAWIALSGRIDDHLSPLTEVSPALVPFAGIEADGGVPRRWEEVVAIDGCSPFDDRFVATRVRAVADVLDADAQLLGRLLASPARSAFDFEVPRRLFRSPANLPVNLTDARALRGMLLTVAATLEIIAEYRWLAGDLQAQIEEHEWSFEDEEPPTRARVFWPTTLAINLETGFFTRPESFDLSRARTHLKDGLSTLSAALRERTATPGLLELTARPSARLVDELSQLTGAMAASIDSTEPVMLPNAPLYSVHFARYFGAPLDAARVRQLMGLLRLWEAHAGERGAPAAAARNPGVEFTLDAQDVRGWSDGLVSYPPLEGQLSCSESESCPTGYTCGGSTCELNPPWFATQEAWEGATRADWPAFISTAVRDALSVDL